MNHYTYLRIGMTFEPSSRMSAILASSRMMDPAVNRFREAVGTRVLSMLTPPEPQATILEAFRAPPRTTVVREYIVSPLSFVSAIIVGALVGGMLVMLRSRERYREQADVSDDCGE